MNVWFVLLFMLFMHIFDDYVLQGLLITLKQRSFWVKNYPQEKYKHDYIAALITHSFSWSFCTMLPVAIYVGFDIGTMFLVIFVFNVLVHAMVDNLKANELSINLIQDQLAHVAQIVATFVVLVVFRL